MKVFTAVSFHVCCIITVATCLPVIITRPFQSRLCQKDARARVLLSNALSLSQSLANEITVLTDTIERKLGKDPFKETNVDFTVPLGRFNKTANTPRQILRVNFRILKIFMSAIKSSMRQLNRLQDVKGLVIDELGSIKNHTKALINHLQRIVRMIQRRGNNPSTQAPQRRNGTVNKPGSRPLKTQTTQDVLLHTKVTLDEFYGHVVTLAADLWKIKRIACN